MSNLIAIGEIDSFFNSINSTLTKLSNLWMDYHPKGDLFWCPPPAAIDEPIREIYQKVHLAFERYGKSSYLIKKTHNFLLRVNNYLAKDGQKLDLGFSELNDELSEPVSAHNWDILKENLLPKLERLSTAICLLLERKGVALPYNEKMEAPENSNKIEFEPIPLTEKAKINQIATIFYELHENGYINTSKANLCRMMQSVFRQSDHSLLKESTLDSYMKSNRPETRPKVLNLSRLSTTT